MLRLLINLPPGFFIRPELQPVFTALRACHEVTTSSCNTAEELLPCLMQADAVLMWSWPALTDDMLDACPRLRFVGQIDTMQEVGRRLVQRGIPASISRRAFSLAVAEMGLGLILSCLRRISTYHAAMATGTEAWVRAFPDDLDSRERLLTGRKVGLVGFGGIGRKLREFLTPFDCPVGIYDPHLPPEVARANGVQPQGLLELFSANDVVVVCASANPGSHRLIQKVHLDALARDAVFINICRSALVDPEALTDRLRRGDLLAAIDVFEQEPLPQDSPLRALPNVYLSPHRAGGIMATAERVLTMLAEDLERFLAGQPRRHALSEAMLPSLDA